MDPMTSLDADLVHRWFGRLRDPEELAMPRWGIVPTEQEATAFDEGEVQIEFAVRDLPPPRMVAPLSEVPARLLRTYLQALAAGISGTRQLLSGSAGMGRSAPRVAEAMRARVAPAIRAAWVALVVPATRAARVGPTMRVMRVGLATGRAGERVGPGMLVVPAAPAGPTNHPTQEHRMAGAVRVERSVIPTHWRWSPA